MPALDDKLVDPVRAMFAHAINQKLVVTFKYKGDIRVVEPHALGMNGKLCAWQLFPEEGWRLFNTFDGEKIEAPTFDLPRFGYRENDSRMPEGIVAQLKAE